MFDFSIESKKQDPGRIRIKYESKNNKKLLKSEIKYQNNQLAGCNFQLNFDSPKKFLMIAKVKFQDNAFELDIINNEEQRLFINIFMENKSILVVSLHKMKRTTDVLKFKMTSIYESLHDIDLFLEKDTGIQQILLKLNDFDGNMTLRDNMMLEQGESLLIHSNLDFMRNLQIDVNLNTTKGHAKVIYVKLNQKFLRIVWSSKDPERSLSLIKKDTNIQINERKKPKYTPLSKRQDRPDAILWLCKNAPELTDGQISKNSISEWPDYSPWDTTKALQRDY